MSTQDVWIYWVLGLSALILNWLITRIRHRKRARVNGAKSVLVDGD